MEGKVELSLKEYNMLRDFFEGIKQGKYCVITYNWESVYYKDENDVIAYLKNKNVMLQNELKELRKPTKPTKLTWFQILFR